MARRKPKTKAQFFEREREAWEELNSLVADLSESDWIQPDATGYWSPKDVWAHLADWMKETRRVMPMLVSGESVSVSIQSFNQEHYERNRDLPLDKARRRAGLERKRLLALFNTTPEEHLLGNRRVYTWASYATYNHYAEHVPHLISFSRRIKRRMQRG